MASEGRVDGLREAPTETSDRRGPAEWQDPGWFPERHSTNLHQRHTNGYASTGRDVASHAAVREKRGKQSPRNTPARHCCRDAVIFQPAALPHGVFVGRVIGYFGRGLVVIAPVAITLGVLVWVLTTVDAMLGIEIPGAGLAITLAIVTFVGFIATHFITRSAVGLFDRLFDKVPLVRLLYNAVRDIFNAFAGDKRRFDQAVSVRIDDAGHVRLFGFVTRQSLAELGLPGHVSVYCPHSYNFSGQLVVVSADRVEAITQPSADVMAFVVSGGVSGLGRSATAPTSASTIPR